MASLPIPGVAARTRPHSGRGVGRDRVVARPPAAGIVGIVLAGAYPSADRDFAGTVPRPLLPVAQMPVVAHALQWLQGSITNATVCGNAASRQVRDVVGSGGDLGLRVSYAEDLMPRGPAGSARDAALESSADTFVVVDATVVPDLDLPSLLHAHRHSGAAVTAVVHYTDRSHAPGERVATPAGIYVFARRAFEAVPALGYQDIKEHLLPLLRDRRERVAAYVAAHACPRVLDAETYLAVNHWTIERLAADGSLGGFAAATVHPTATIVGPVLIGAGASIGPHALLVGPSSIGPDTRVGERATVCRSVVWHESTIGDGAFVDASIVGDRLTIAPSSALHGDVRVNHAPAPTRRGPMTAALPKLRPAPAGASVADLALP